MLEHSMTPLALSKVFLFYFGIYCGELKVISIYTLKDFCPKFQLVDKSISRYVEHS